eukprot:363618-Chlamydomonas_euryale.AAC.4
MLPPPGQLPCRRHQASCHAAATRPAALWPPQVLVAVRRCILDNATTRNPACIVRHLVSLPCLSALPGRSALTTTTLHGCTVSLPYLRAPCCMAALHAVHGRMAAGAHGRPAFVVHGRRLRRLFRAQPHHGAVGASVHSRCVSVTRLRWFT